MNQSKRKWSPATLRPWVQTSFLFLWLAPLGQMVQRIPSCVFHCYACPLASFACPIGLIASFVAVGLIPLMVIGVLVAVGALVGSLACGWACPFGFIQDLIARIPTPKFHIPAWMGYGRYLTLIGLVLLVPFFFGENHPLSFCRVCPAGALEAALPRGILPSWPKLTVLGVVLGAALFFHRPWCRVLCPLGGLLALFNRVSLFHLRFSADGCTECNLCRSRCSYGVKLDQTINDTACIRCLECTSCRGISADVAMPRVRRTGSAPERIAPG